MATSKDKKENLYLSQEIEALKKYFYTIHHCIS